MSKDTETLMEQIVSRMSDNHKSLEIINTDIEKNIEDATRTMTREYKNLSSERLIEISKDLGIDEINYYNKDGILTYSNIPENIGWIPENDHPIPMFMKSDQNELMEDLRQDGVSEVYFKYGAFKNPDGSVVQAGIQADYINDITEQFGYQSLIEDLAQKEEIVFALFVDKNLQAVAHDDKDRIGIDLSQDAGSISAVVNEEIFVSDSDMHLGTIPTYNIVYPVSIAGEHVGALNVGLSMADVKASVTRNRNIIVLSGLIASILLGLILYFTSNYTIKTINKLKVKMHKMASGDFTIDELENSKYSDDELGEIADSVDKMKFSIRSILENIIDKAQLLAAQSEEMAATTHQSVKAADKVSHAIEDIAKGSSEQALDTEQGFITVKDLGEMVKINSTHITDLNNSTIKVNSLKEEGLELINDLVDKTEINIRSSKEVQNIIQETSDSVIEIENASTMIKNIASQTNLLALNASIEAARAGDAGRGFSVVADEIRKLAEESNKFTEEIGNIINELITKIGNTVKTMEQVSETTALQGTSVNLTSNKFDGIAIALNEMEEAINVVSQASDNIANKNININGIMRNLADISQENAASSEEVSASMEEQTAAMEEISNTSYGLSKIAEELSTLIEKFKI